MFVKYSLAEHQAKKTLAKSFTESTSNVVGYESKFALEESEGEKKREKLIVQLEAIHVGKTRNHTWYTAEGLKAGLATWTSPYNKPVLTHHESHRGEPIGRIMSAQFQDSMQSGRAGLLFEVEITDPEAIEKVKDGRYSTVSIGGHTDKVTCNCCGTDRTQEWCEHYPGETYDGIQCHFIIGETYGEEVSYVNVPADINAGNISVTSVTESVKDIVEPTAPQATPAGHVSVTESTEGGVDDTTLQTDPENPVQENHTDETDPKEPEGADGAVTESEGDEEPPAQTEDKGIVLTESQMVVEKTDYEDLKRQITEYQSKEITANVNLQLATEERDALLEKLKGYDALVKESLVQEIFSLKESLGKPDADAQTKESTLTALRSRQMNSLEDLKADLIAEQTAQASTRPDPIANPAGAAQTSEGAHSTEAQKDKPVTLGEAVKGLIMGPRKK